MAENCIGLVAVILGWDSPRRAVYYYRCAAAQRERSSRPLPRGRHFRWSLIEPGGAFPPLRILLGQRSHRLIATFGFDCEHPSGSRYLDGSAFGIILSRSASVIFSIGRSSARRPRMS